MWKEKYKVSVTVTKYGSENDIDIIFYKYDLLYLRHTEGCMCGWEWVLWYASPGKACTAFILRKVLCISEFKLNSGIN